VRVAHIPFDEDLISGTLCGADAPGREAQQKLEAVFVARRRSGTTRSWYPNGKGRSVLRYEVDEQRRRKRGRRRPAVGRRGARSPSRIASRTSATMRRLPRW
jgi:hypothetical protein